MLYKSKGLRTDEVDAAEVIPTLDDSRRRFLSGVLPPGHPWRLLLT